MVDKLAIKATLQDFLERTNIRHLAYQEDDGFCELVISDAASRGIDVQAFHKYLVGGITMGQTAYKHLKSIPARVIISLYTAFLIYLDDQFSEDVTMLKEFCHLFCARKPQAHPMLDHYANLLLEMTEYFSPLASDLVVLSGMKMVTALVLENRMQATPVSRFVFF